MKDGRDFARAESSQKIKIAEAKKGDIPMKIILAPDSFKGSLSAVRVCEIMRDAANRVFPGCETALVPVADGGEGTVDALVLALNGTRQTAEVTGPLGSKVMAEYGVLGDACAVIELAQASGLPLMGAEKDPLRATSRGTGELIRMALEAGYVSQVIGIGGSATNDCGMGMLSALGARFLDADGKELSGCGADMERVERVDLSQLHPALAKAEIEVICDVTNPLLGANGATSIYGPQKGVTPKLFPRLEAGMHNIAKALEQACGRSISEIPGAGAAGGVGAALAGVLGAKLRSGIDAVLDRVQFDSMLEDCDLVLTGEGRLDRQSVEFGKAPTGVALRCKQKDIPVIAVVGSTGAGAQAYFDVAESSIITTVSQPMCVEQAMENAAELLLEATERALRMVRIGMKIERGQ